MSVLTDEQIADGWIAHDGGPCPVAENQTVWVMLPDDARILAFASAWTGPGYNCWTGDCDPDERIIAYKPSNG